MLHDIIKSNIVWFIGHKETLISSLFNISHYVNINIYTAGQNFKANENKGKNLPFSLLDSTTYLRGASKKWK